jgi:hypothetical protein
MYKESEKTLSGNNRYEGFIVDMLEEISKLRKFNYTLQEVKDGAYGSLNEHTGRWSGMVGELVRGVSMAG